MHKLEVAQLNQKDPYGWAPLHILAQNKRGSETKTAMMVQLVNHGADVDLAGPRSATPLMKASSTGAIQQATCLIYHNCDVDKTNDEGTTAWDMAWGNTPMLNLLASVQALEGAGVTGTGRCHLGGIAAASLLGEKPETI